MEHSQRSRRENKEIRVAHTWFVSSWNLFTAANSPLTGMVETGTYFVCMICGYAEAWAMVQG
jgi:hypothetical protein